jgi:lipid-A-disaccharide synthase
MRAARPLRVFLVAGEHSGDALGAKLMSALGRLHSGPIAFAGVGGEAMEAEGLQSLFPIAEVTVMGPGAILRRLAPIVRRAYRTIDAAVAFAPDVVVIIDSPEFTHPIARRIRRRRPDIPIVDYVSPSVWAWRPGRAKAMRPYVDHLLALLPFEPAAHARLGGPPCTYVGHPLVERIETIAALDPEPLRRRLGLDVAKPVLVVLPGSRRSEVGRLVDVFRETVARIVAGGIVPEVVMPTVPHLRAMIEDGLAAWPVRPHLVVGEDDKWLAFRLADAALAASGTVTLELAVAGTPMVIAYRIERWFAPILRRLLKTDTAGLSNLVVGRKVFPELMQEDCTPEKLAAEVVPLLSDTPQRRDQLAVLEGIPGQLAVPHGRPSDMAAEIVLIAAGTMRSAAPEHG